MEADTKPHAWYTLFGGHNAWDYAYEGVQLIDWFLKHAK
jgi:hypothetical protein